MKNNENHERSKKLAESGLLLAAGLVLPFLTGQIPTIGSMLLPMHIPILLCGFICGPSYGLVVGFLCPLIRSVLFGMPKLFPTALAMAFELATYGFVSGFLYQRSRWQCVAAAEKCLIAAMLAGRAVWGIVMFLLMRLTGQTFPLSAFLSGAFLNAVPGIVLQLVLIPALLVALNKAGLVPFRHASGRRACEEH